MGLVTVFWPAMTTGAGELFVAAVLQLVEGGAALVLFTSTKCSGRGSACAGQQQPGREKPGRLNSGMVQVPRNSSLSYGRGGQGYWVFPRLTTPLSSLGNGLGPLTNEVRKLWPGSVLRRPEESMVHAVRADVIPDNDAVVTNRSYFRCQGAGRVNRGEDALVVDKAVRVAQSVVVPSRHLAEVVDGERNRVNGARRLGMAENAIDAHHGVCETARLIGGK